MSRSLERGLRTLFFLSTRKSVGVTELAQELQINKSTAYRILETLQKYNMVEQSKSSAKYRLGPAILRLSDQLYKNLNIIALARPHMIRLADEVGESVHLCLLCNDSAVVIEQIITNSRLIVNAKIGNIEPLHASSVGKCLLAFSEPAIMEQLLNRMEFPAFTDKTITDREAMRAEIEKIKAQGYAVDNGELSSDIKCVAVPVYNHMGEAIYSLGISGPLTRMTESKTEDTVKKLLKTRDALSALLGYAADQAEGGFL
ncbi:MAG TPA: IclR family transcriptional regulator [Bacillota bacterium]|nr:IclR family transcriptional regulator [Bacillota bacterium]